MTDSERRDWLVIWNMVCVFGSLIVLGMGWLASGAIAIFVAISCGLGYGERHLMRMGFALSVLAIAIVFVPVASAKMTELSQYAPSVLTFLRPATANLN